MKRATHAGSVAALVAATLWMGLAMMSVHELGHVLGAAFTGGAITSLELRPFRFSHTLVRPNPHPAVVLWGGFVVGWLAPLATAPAWRIEPALVGPLLRAWAAFCWLAGGSYLALGYGGRFTDTGQLIAAGWPLAALVAVGAAVAVIGYAWSRAAWRGIAERLRRRPLGWREAALWCAFLATWTAGQWGLHHALAP